MAENIRLLTLAVAIVVLLGNALVAQPSPVFAELTSNPIPGNTCVFQNPARLGPLADYVYMDPSWPIYYQKDPVMPGLHFTNGQWAGLDIIETTLKLPFVSGGTVIANSGSTYDREGGGFGVTYEGIADCINWLAGYWHNPSPVAYEIGQEIDANSPAGTPGCTGFDAYCGSKEYQIPPHIHFSIGYRSVENPFSADIPAYHTISQNPAIGSVWWINPLRVIDNVDPQKINQIWYEASQNQAAWYTTTTPTQSPVNTTLILIGVVVVCILGLIFVSGKGSKLMVVACGITMGVWVFSSIRPHRDTNWYQPTTVSAMYSKTSTTSLDNNSRFVGIYGRHNGWGSVGVAANTPKEVLVLVQELANKISTLTRQSVTPVIYLNVIGAGVQPESPDTIDAYLTEMSGQAIVSLDIQPVAGNSLTELCQIYGAYARKGVWFSLDTENIKGTPAATINECARIISEAYTKSNATGVIGIWEFGSGLIADPENIAQLDNVTIVPLFDGWGSPAAKLAGYQSMLARYRASSGGFMQWTTLYGTKYDGPIPAAPDGEASYSDPSEYYIPQLPGLEIYIRY